MKKKIIITGCSGFLGSKISKALLDRDYHVVGIDIRPPSVEGVDFIQHDITTLLPDSPLLKNPHAYIHLAGKNIFAKFTSHHKEEIYSSRIMSSKRLRQLFKRPDYRPDILLCASATGYYGNTNKETVSESDSPGRTFLSDVVKDWEKENTTTATLGIRTVIFRQGIIIGAGGIVSVLHPYFQKKIGGSIAGGNFAMPWIHINDLVALYIHALEMDSYEGIYNAVSPTIITNKEFSKEFADLMGQPVLFSIPKLALALRYGGLVNEIAIPQRVRSERLSESLFDHTNIKSAIKDALSEIEKKDSEN